MRKAVTESIANIERPIHAEHPSVRELRYIHQIFIQHYKLFKEIHKEVGDAVLIDFSETEAGEAGLYEHQIILAKLRGDYKIADVVNA